MGNLNLANITLTKHNISESEGVVKWLILEDGVKIYRNTQKKKRLVV